MADEVEQFDPLKVERYYGARDGYEVVVADDYDKLLALWQQRSIQSMPELLAGATVTPIDGGQFNGIVWVPKEFFIEGRTDREALQAYLESDHLENVQDILKDVPAPKTTQLFRPDLLERMLQISPGAALAELADEVDDERVKVFRTSVQGNGMDGGNRVVFDVRFSIEVV